MAQMDTTKAGLKSLFLKMVEKAPKSTKTEQFKMANFVFIADALGVKDAKIRSEGWKQYQATMGSFGTNQSAFNKACDLEESKEDTTGFTGEI